MGTLQADSEEKRDMDDSGCVEDASTPTNESQESRYRGSAELLELSDDVLLCILKYCSPQDLKALGYTCPRLGTLIRDRTLWQSVDARAQPCGRARLRWMLAHCLNASTKKLLLTGYAKQAEGCQGLVNRTRQEVNDAERAEQELGQQSDASEGSDTTSAEGEARHPEPPYPLFRQHARLHINAQPLPRFNTSPVWPEELAELSEKMTSSSPHCSPPTECPGPQFTLTQGLLRQLRLQCSDLTSLALDYCNINCDTTGINHFPQTLKMLSLRGTKCYNLHNQSFLFKIQDYLPLLEDLDVSECAWLEPAALLPLSKLRALARLRMRECARLAEFVAYCALATRYGFPSLQMVDLRGSPVGDSEVAGLGWVRSLQELYVSAPAPPRHAAAHAHCRGDALPAHGELQPWEFQEPEYFKTKKFAMEGDAASDTTTESLDDPVEDTVCVEASETLRNEGVRILVRPRERIGVIESRPRGDIIGYMDARPRCGAENVPRDPERGFITIKRRVQENGSGDSAEVNRNEPGPSQKRSRPHEDGEKPSQYINISSMRNLKHNSDNQIDDEASSSKNQPQEGDKNPSQSKYVTVSSIRNMKRTVDCQTNEDASPSKKTCQSDDNESGPSPKQPVITITISSTRNVKRNIDDEASSKKLCQIDFNDGASTSKSDATDTPSNSNCHNATKNTEDIVEASKEQLDSNVSNTSDCEDDISNCSKANNRGSSPSNSENSVDSNDRQRRPKFERYIRFRQNQDPVVIQCPPVPRANPEPEMPEHHQNPPENPPENQDGEPRHHILYVNVGQQLHAVYRLLPDRPAFQEVRNRRHSGRNFYLVPQTHPSHIDSSTFVTDLAVSSFGRADGDNVNYIHIGPNGPVPMGAGTGMRPNRSNLRVLSMNGFRHITDRSLVHLATAAPHLRRVDFSRTSVTEQGVENFKSLRPDCEVVFSPFIDKNETTD